METQVLVIEDHSDIGIKEFIGLLSVKNPNKKKNDIPPNCDCCNERMVLRKDFGKKMRAKKMYKIKRYYCSVCDLHKTIFLSGCDLIINDVNNDKE